MYQSRLKLSQHANDEIAFSPYVIEKFERIGEFYPRAYYCAISEDVIPIILTMDSHFLKRCAERLLIYDVEPVVNQIVSELENNLDLAHVVLDVMDECQQKADFVLAFPEKDTAFYMELGDEHIHISTVIVSRLFFVRPGNTCVSIIGKDENKKTLLGWDYPWIAKNTGHGGC